MRCLFILVAILAAVPARALTLPAKSGAGTMIALSSSSTTAERTAAAELAVYLTRVTGAAFSIGDETFAPKGGCIYVGPTAFARKLGINFSALSPEEWIIRTHGNSLILVGGRPRGTLYAVYRFLEDHVGVRWWNPHEEFVPSRASLELPDLHRKGNPAFLYRDIYGFDAPDTGRFCARNRLNGHFTLVPAELGGTLSYGPPYHVHTFYTYLPPEKHFDAHPEYYSEINGKRAKGRYQLCLTNPEVLRLVIERLRQHIQQTREAAKTRGVPSPNVFSISQNDWGGACQCRNCQAVTRREGSEAGPLIEFVNKVADAVKTAYPDVFIDTLAYQYTLDPPRTLRPRDNVIIRVCNLSGGDLCQPFTHASNRRFHDALIGWLKIARHVRVWDYAVTYGTYQGLPLPNLSAMAANYRFLQARKVEGVFLEHEYPIAADMRDLKVWMQAKLLEDPSRDFHTLLLDFTEGYYGAAGKHVREYLSLLNQASLHRTEPLPAFAPASAYRFLNLDFMRRAHALFDRAENAVAADPVLLRRVRHTRLSLDHATLLFWRPLCREHAARGGSAPGMALRRDRVIGPRYLETWNTQIDLRVPASRRAALKRETHRRIEGWLALAGFPAVPEPLHAVPRSDLFDFTPDTFRRWRDIATLAPDGSAATGAVARLRLEDVPPAERERYLLTADRPMPWGVYDIRNRKALATGHIRPEDVPGPGYHLYRLGQVRLTPGAYVHFFWSWVVQVDLDRAFDPAHPEQLYDIYASLRFLGPAFPHGEADAPNAISVERVFAVKATAPKAP